MMPFFVLEHMYRRPYLRRLKAIDRQMKAARAARPGGTARADKPQPLPDRDLFAADAVKRWGGTAEQWKAEYDRGKAARVKYDEEMTRARNGK